MPVSSPSYFPPQRSADRIVGLNAGIGQTGNRVFLAGLSAGTYTTQSDLIVIGDEALSSGTASAPITDANSQYSIFLGSSAGKSLTTFSGLSAGPAIIIGGNSWNSTQTGSSVIAVGCNIFPSATNAAGAAGGNYIGLSIFIGHGIGLNTPAGSYIARDTIIIGNRAAASINDPIYGHTSNLIIGNEAMAGSSFANPSGVDFNVVIGNFAATALLSGSNVFIGDRAAQNYAGPLTNGLGAVCIGASSGFGNNNSARNLICIGCQSVIAGGDRAVVVGTNISVDAAAGNDNTILGDNTLKTFNFGSMKGSRCILLGSNAGSGDTNTNSDRLIAETYDGATLRSLLYGVMGTGNLIVGNSAPGTNRDMPGTNILKLLAGTTTGTPVGGGMFYVAGANNDVHWVGSDGTDTNLTAGAAGALPYTYNAPVTGFAITVGNNITQLILEPAGTLASGTVTLPAAPEDGDTVGISSTQAITALTISPNAGQTVADAPASFAVGGAVKFLYRATNTTWYRIGN